MSERKYTDEEIIKAFELCLTPQGTTYTCKKCPLHELGNLCKVERNRRLLALVKTQKADLEITARQFDDLSKVSNKLHSENMSQRAELEDLREIVFTDRTEAIKNLKAEAIKEFVEKLKQWQYESSDWSHGEHPYVVEVNEIDNLVAEMTEGE